MANPNRICSIPDCGKPVKGRGWCDGHYHRWTRHGDPMGGGTFYGGPKRFLDETVPTFHGTGCLKWPFACTTAGYPEIRLDGQTRLVHRIACEAANGPAPSPEHEAAHICGKGHEGCCNPHHLAWKTRSENKQDELDHGTRNRGARNGSARLTLDQARSIRALEGTMAATAIAKMFGITDASVRDIFKRRTWDWL